MKYKIVADSSADIHALDGIEFSSAPLKINIGERIFVDDANLDVMEMVDVLRAYKGRTTTACPNTEEYLEAFGDADRVFCITISGNLSGSYNAARLAKEQYEEEHPECKVHIIDSLQDLHPGAASRVFRYPCPSLRYADQTHEQFGTLQNSAAVWNC